MIVATRTKQAFVLPFPCSLEEAKKEATMLGGFVLQSKDQEIF